MSHFHPKVRAALALLAIEALTAGVALLADFYPQHVLTALAAAALPVIAGYLKSADAPS